MSRYFEADHTNDDCTEIKLSDGRVTNNFNGVDHSASPSEVAEVINELTASLKKGQEVVEVVLGDDCLWWAVVDVE